MDEQTLQLLSQLLQIAFLISLVAAALVIRNAMRRRHAERLRKEQDETATDNGLRKDV
jgi:hypothetical protein